MLKVVEKCDFIMLKEITPSYIDAYYETKYELVT